MKKIFLLLIGICMSIVTLGQKVRDYKYTDYDTNSSSDNIDPLGCLILMGVVVLGFLLYFLGVIIKIKWVDPLRKYWIENNVTDKITDLFRKKLYDVENFHCIGGTSIKNLLKGKYRISKGEELKLYDNDHNEYFNLTGEEYMVYRKGIFFYKVKGIPIGSDHIITIVVTKSDFKNKFIYKGTKILKTEELLTRKFCWWYPEDKESKEKIPDFYDRDYDLW